MKEELLLDYGVDAQFLRGKGQVPKHCNGWGGKDLCSWNGEKTEAAAAAVE